MRKKYLVLLMTALALLVLVLLGVCWFVIQEPDLTPAVSEVSGAPTPVTEDGLPAQPTFGTLAGRVQTGVQVGSDACPEGLYLVYQSEVGDRPSREQRLLKVRDKQGNPALFAETAYVGKRVSVGVSEPLDQGVQCKALSCNCERSVFIEAMGEE